MAVCARDGATCACVHCERMADIQRRNWFSFDTWKVRGGEREGDGAGSGRVTNTASSTIVTVVPSHSSTSL